ncbi:hypothetical protein NL108_000303, partial [Boleophthalmus pectinirostris]
MSCFFVCVCEDLSGKMFTFPLETSWAHVRITTSRQHLAATTVCFRYFTDLTKEFGMFSMATSSHQNSFTIFKKARTDHFQVFVRDALAEYYGQEYKINTWQSLCSTWDSSTGLTQLWLNGIPSARKFITTSEINGPIIIVLGQEQDSHGGGFDIKQSFVGMTADLHMWDYALSPVQILNYSHNITVPEGNLLRWGSLEFQKTSRVEIED